MYGIFESMLKILGSRHFHKFGHVIRAMADVNKLHLGMLFNFPVRVNFEDFTRIVTSFDLKKFLLKLKILKEGFFVLENYSLPQTVRCKVSLHWVKQFSKNTKM